MDKTESPQAVAERLLPCVCDGAQFNGDKWEEWHPKTCPAHARPAIAAEIAKREKETWPSVYSCQNCERTEAEIAKLQAENEKLKADAEAKAHDVRYNGDFFFKLQRELGFGSPGDFWRVYNQNLSAVSQKQRERDAEIARTSFHSPHSITNCGEAIAAEILAKPEDADGR